MRVIHFIQLSNLQQIGQKKQILKVYIEDIEKEKDIEVRY